MAVHRQCSSFACADNAQEYWFLGSKPAKDSSDLFVWGHIQPPLPIAPLTRTKWTELANWGIFKNDEWFEPGETLADELLLFLGGQDPMPIRLVARIVWKPNSRWRWRNIEISCSQILIPETPSTT